MRHLRQQIRHPDARRQEVLLGTAEMSARYDNDAPRNGDEDQDKVGEGI